MVDIWQEPEVYSRIIHENEDGLEQVRLTINTFREILIGIWIRLD